MELLESILSYNKSDKHNIHYFIVREQYLKENVYLSSFNQRKWKKMYQIEVFQYIHIPDDFLEHYSKTLLCVPVIHIPFGQLQFMYFGGTFKNNNNKNQANKQKQWGENKLLAWYYLLLKYSIKALCNLK